MICWDRCGTQVIGTFERRQIRWLRFQLVGLREVLCWRAEQYEPHPDWPGVLVAPPTLCDERLSVMLETYLSPAEPEILRAWREPDVVDMLRQQIQVVLNSLPQDSAVVHLTVPVDVKAWASVLLDLRTFIAVGAGVCATLELPLPGSMPDGEHRKISALTWWLRAVVTDLVETARLPQLV